MTTHPPAMLITQNSQVPIRDRADTPPSARSMNSSTSLSWARTIELDVQQTVGDTQPTQENQTSQGAQLSQSKMPMHNASPVFSQAHALPDFLNSQPLTQSIPIASMPAMPFPSPSTFNSFLLQNPASAAAVNAMNSSLILPAFGGMNLSCAIPANSLNSSGFTFPTVPQPNAQTPILLPMPAPVQRLQSQSQPENTHSITANFLKTYYNELHSNPGNLEKYYHVDAIIDHTDTDTELGVFEGGVTFVDINKITDQKAVSNSILIRVNGAMRFEKAASRQFEQIFFLNKSVKGFWLINNDIFWLLKGEVAQNSNAHAQQKRAANVRTNDAMVNRYYHDTSYQCFNNNLAVFIRPIPNTVTHANLAALLQTYIEGVQIAYIDVNYHKQFAFVYFHDRRSFERALECGEIFINEASAQIQVKRSKNKPRTFGFPRRQ